MLSPQAKADLAGKLQIKAEKLDEVLTSETEQGLETLGIPVNHFFTDEQKTEFGSNLQKKGYEAGKTAGVEMQFKEIKKNYEDIEANDMSTLLSKINGVYDTRLQSELEKQKNELGTGTDDRIELLKKEKEEISNKFLALQGTFDGTMEKHKNEISSLNNQFLMKGAESEIMAAVSSLQFEIPSDIEKQGETKIQEYLHVKRSNAFNLFKSQYSVAFTEDGKAVYKQGDNIIKDTYENALPVSKFINDFAKTNYLSLKKESQRGRAGESSTGLASGLKACKNREECNAFIESKGINIQSDDGTKMYIEWKKLTGN